jgi:hypothetical protein
MVHVKEHRMAQPEQQQSVWPKGCLMVSDLVHSLGQVVQLVAQLVAVWVM